MQKEDLHGEKSHSSHTFIKVSHLLKFWYLLKFGFSDIYDFIIGIIFQ
jgi:hypothetical protein